MTKALRDIARALQGIQRELRQIRTELEITWTQLTATIRESSPETASQAWMRQPRPDNID